MNITWSTNASGAWRNFNLTSAVGNGTYNAYNVSWVNSYFTKYYWNVSVNDTNNNWDNQSYSFTTRADDNPPIATNEQPTNQSTAIRRFLLFNNSHFNITLLETDGDTMNITWSTNASGAWRNFNLTSAVGNGTYNAYNVSWVKDNSTRYYWNVSVNDTNNNWDNQSFYFDTGQDYTPYANRIVNNFANWKGTSFLIFVDKPGAHIRCQFNETNDFGAPKYIKWDNTSYWTAYGYRHQDISDSDISSGFTPNCTVYYRMTIYNGSDTDFSSTFDSSIKLWSPEMGLVSPSDDAVNVSVDTWFNVSVNITNGDAFTLYYFDGEKYVSNGTISTQGGGVNKTCGYFRTGLNYSQDYWWYARADTNNSEVNSSSLPYNITVGTRSAWTDQFAGTGREHWSFDTEDGGVVNSTNPATGSTGVMFSPPVTTCVNMTDNFTGYAVMNRTEFYTTGDTTHVWFDGDGAWLYQKFTIGTVGVDADYILDSIRLKFWKVDGTDIGNVNVSIRTNPADGANLSWGSIGNSEISTGMNYINCSMSPMHLLPSTTYYIIVSARQGVPNKLGWRVDMTGTYTGGNADWSADGGASWWGIWPNYDFWFEVYGVNATFENVYNISLNSNSSGTWDSYYSGIIYSSPSCFQNNNFSSNDTTYWWSINGSEINNESFWFRTRENYPAGISNPLPANGTAGVSISLYNLSCTITDLEGDLFNFTIECNNSDSISINYSANTTWANLTLTGLAYSTNYTWWVNVTDGMNSSNATFWFVTGPEPTSPPPGGGGGTGQVFASLRITIIGADATVFILSGYLINMSKFIEDGDEYSFPLPYGEYTIKAISDNKVIEREITLNQLQLKITIDFSVEEEIGLNTIVLIAIVITVCGLIIFTRYRRNKKVY